MQVHHQDDDLAFEYNYDIQVQWNWNAGIIALRSPLETTPTHEATDDDKASLDTWKWLQLRCGFADKCQFT